METVFNCPVSLKDDVAAALVGFENVIGPLPGNVGKGGGDPTRLYYNVRVESGPTPVLPIGCADTDPVLSTAILGSWA